ncbi:hypothetical protein SUGI_0550200 [Cryptomeria japonica]|nr:hypothetical protein SUGI_0550200 [Cryptomeria japonica]
MVAKTEEREVFRGLQENEAARPSPSRESLRGLPSKEGGLSRREGGGDRLRLVSQSNDNLPLLTVEGLCTACPCDRQSSRPAYPRTLTFYKKFIRHELD